MADPVPFRTMSANTITSSEPCTVSTSNCHNDPDYDAQWSIMMVIISCGRWHLLSQTIESFEQYNTYNCIESKIIIDDCITDKHELSTIESKYKHYGYQIVPTSTPRTINYSQSNLRTMFSIYEAITTYNTKKARYVFQIEDDWKFYKHGFIEDSLAVLKSDAKKIHYDGVAFIRRISMLDLRNWQIHAPYLGYNAFCGGYMTQNDIGDIYDTIYDGYGGKKLKYWIYPTSNDHGIECFRHWSANPGLKKINGLEYYIERCMDELESGKFIFNFEHCVACQYKRKGYGMANTINYSGYVGHLGGLFHVDQNRNVTLTENKTGYTNLINLNTLMRINDKYAINTSNCEYVEL